MVEGGIWGVVHLGFVSWGPHSHPVPRRVAGAGSGGSVLGWGAHACTEHRLAWEEGDWPRGFLELSPNWRQGRELPQPRNC